jgi:antitoxin component of MazEF toxin-antitoxin module
MKLQKQLSRKIGNTEYAKFVTVIPPQIIKDLGWEDGQELETEVKDNKLVIRKKK